MTFLSDKNKKFAFKKLLMCAVPVMGKFIFEVCLFGCKGVYCPLFRPHHHRHHYYHDQVISLDQAHRYCYVSPHNRSQSDG